MNPDKVDRRVGQGPANACISEARPKRANQHSLADLPIDDETTNQGAVVIGADERTGEILTRCVELVVSKS